MLYPIHCSHSREKVLWGYQSTETCYLFLFFNVRYLSYCLNFNVKNSYFIISSDISFPLQPNKPQTFQKLFTLSVTSLDYTASRLLPQIFQKPQDSIDLSTQLN